jgi:hypothetical protein
MRETMCERQDGIVCVYAYKHTRTQKKLNKYTVKSNFNNDKMLIKLLIVLFDS